MLVDHTMTQLSQVLHHKAGNLNRTRVDAAFEDVWYTATASSSKQPILLSLSILHALTTGSDLYNIGRYVRLGEA